MPQKYVYLLEHFINERPTNIGVFTSIKKAKSFLKTMPKKYSYVIYKLPLNINLTKGRKYKDQQGIYEHWHYGTNEVDYISFDDNDNVIEKGKKTIAEWPD